MRWLLVAVLLLAGCGSTATPAAAPTLATSPQASGQVNFRVFNGTVAIYVQADNPTVAAAILPTLKAQPAATVTQVASLPSGSEMTCGNADDTITVWDTGGTSQVAAESFCSGAGYS